MTTWCLSFSAMPTSARPSGLAPRASLWRVPWTTTAWPSPTGASAACLPASCPGWGTTPGAHMCLGTAALPWRRCELHTCTYRLGSHRGFGWLARSAAVCSGQAKQRDTDPHCMRRGRSSAWVVDGAEMSASLGMEEVRLINDFVANGYGLLTLDEATETVTIQVCSPMYIPTAFPGVSSSTWAVRIGELRASSRSNT